MSHCPECAKLERQLSELQRLVNIYGVALSDIRFSANDALRQTSTLTKPIEDLELMVRTTNILRAEGIKTIGDLVNYGYKRLSHSTGIGRKALVEIRETLAQYRLEMQP